MRDRQYERDRNALIPEAESHATRTVRPGSFDSDEKYRAAWSREFHTKMNELWRMRARAGRSV